MARPTALPARRTRKAIRNFEVYFNYKVTGRIIGGACSTCWSRVPDQPRADFGHCRMFRTDLWVAAFVRRHNDIGHMCVVTRRGDPIAGQIFVEVDHLNGEVSLYMPAPATALADEQRERVYSSCASITSSR